MNTYNILNGDSMRDEFEQAHVGDQIVVFREGLVDGDLSGETLPELWNSRSAYMGVSKEKYQKVFASEILKILNAPQESEFNLWFEDDLFCQVNLWFLLSLLSDLQIHKKVYVVYSFHLSKEDKHFWNGFGRSDRDDLKQCFKQRLLLSETDILFGKELWIAYKNGDLDRLKSISAQALPSFPYLREVVAAHLDRYSSNNKQSRVENVIAEIIKKGSTKFDDAFAEFRNTESIYGFGDIQFRRMYDQVKAKM